MIGLYFGIVVAAVLFRLGIMCFRAKSFPVKASPRDVVMGRAYSHGSLLEDGYTTNGMVFNRRKNRIECTSRLNDRTIRNLFS